MAIAGQLADRLDEDGLRYAFGGALALGAWGVPRATSDVDIAIFVGEDQLARVFDALDRAGAVIDRGEATSTVARAGFFVAAIARTRIDVFLAHHPWHFEMERRRQALATPEGVKRWFLSCEDIVVAKLVFGRAKDLVDLERLFVIQGARLDVAYVEHWLSKIVAAGDRRHRELADLVARFGG